MWQLWVSSYKAISDYIKEIDNFHELINRLDIPVRLSVLWDEGTKILKEPAGLN